MLFIYTKFHENGLQKFSNYRADTISILTYIKGHNSDKNVELRFSISAHRLMILYICLKLHENIFDGFKVIKRTQFPY